MRRRWTSAAARRIKEHAGVTDIDQAIDRIALRLLDGVNCPPTDLDALLDRLNVDRVESDCEVMATGALKREGHKLVIQVFPGQSTGRRRFTIAHELAHAFMETTGPHAPRVGEELEEICDRFAAEILMPRRMFLNHVGRSPDIALAFDAAAAFCTSRTAVFRRLRDLCRMKSCEYECGAFNWSFGLNNIARINLRHVLDETTDNEGRRSVELHFGRSYSRFSMEWRRWSAHTKLLCLLTPS